MSTSTFRVVDNAPEAPPCPVGRASVHCGFP